MTTPRPTDLVTIAAAAHTVGRPPGTVRRWVRDGQLQAWDGEPPRGGGPPARLVSVAAVRELAGPPVAAPASAEPGAAPGEADRLRVELEAVRAELVAARADAERWRSDAERLRVDLAAARASLDERTHALTQASRERVEERERLQVDVERERRERLAERVAHQRAAEALAVLSGDLDRYGQLGPVGRMLQAPPSARRIAGPVSAASDVEDLEG